VLVFALVLGVTVAAAILPWLGHWHGRLQLV